MKSSSSSTSSYASVSTLVMVLAPPSLGLPAACRQLLPTNGTIVLAFFFPLALSRSSACLVLPRTLSELETFRVCTALRPSHSSFARISTNVAYSGLEAWREVISDVTSLASSTKSSFVLGLAV